MLARDLREQGRLYRRELGRPARDVPRRDGTNGTGVDGGSLGRARGRERPRLQPRGAFGLG